MIDIKLKDKKALLSLKDMPNATDRGIRSSFYWSGKGLVKRANRMILDPPKTGKVYRINGRNHRASAPGEAPANLTGTLRRSIDFEVRGSMNMTFGANAPYAKYLEDGTEKMKARPYLLPAIYQEQKNMLANFERYIKKEVSE